jgi:Holliday junction resolvase RusA-like endonuclease
VKPTDMPIILSLSFTFIRPKSISEKKRPFHIVKPDLDNCIKGVKDALKGIAWNDDSQVISIHAMKSYADEPGVKIRIEHVE